MKSSVYLGVMKNLSESNAYYMTLSLPEELWLVAGKERIEKILDLVNNEIEMWKKTTKLKLNIH